MITRPGPTLFYHSSDFEGERGRAVPVDVARADLKIVGKSEACSQQYRAMLKTVGFERYGRLRGEYAYVSPFMLIDRYGCCTLINAVGDDPMPMQQLHEFWESENSKNIVRSLLANWDKLPVFENTSVIGEPYAWNYFHFTTLLIPKTRFYESAQSSILPGEYLAKTFQKSLLGVIINDRPIYPISAPCRVIDPVIAQTTAFKDNFLWLHERVKFGINPGSKKYYITRGGTTRKMSGAISETPDFTKIINDFGFEQIQFGDGELTIEQQVALLQDAGIVLTSHGAHITNLVYLDTPLALIEVLPPLSRHLSLSVYMEMAADLGFRYRGLIAEGYNADGRLELDCAILRDILSDLGAG